MFNIIKNLFGTTPIASAAAAMTPTSAPLKPADVEPEHEVFGLMSVEPEIVVVGKKAPKGGYTLSDMSRKRLVGVKPQLIKVVERAIELTTQDFRVQEGLRSLATQKKYVAQGVSQTLKSKHLTGDAVDLVALVGSRVSWELNLYDEIADAMRKAAIELNVGICWGGAWNVPDIRKWNGTMESAMNHYVDARRKQGKRAFIDGPHYQLA